MSKSQYEQSNLSIIPNADYILPVKKIKKELSVKKTVSEKNINIAQTFDTINLLFGEMRNLNEEETKEYKNILKKNFKNTRVNFFDIL